LGLVDSALRFLRDGIRLLSCVEQLPKLRLELIHLLALLFHLPLLRSQSTTKGVHVVGTDDSGFWRHLLRAGGGL
jgi:hypothetical protein